ncbi:hypothetical protein AB4Z46_31050 [Variovorax sp. M-6]|uniref:hypothetical protein n=1 Tax=Variovorax sp. M-6 TaxID=3233041 RepID=UPI003F958909
MLKRLEKDRFIWPSADAVGVDDWHGTPWQESAQEIAHAVSRVHAAAGGHKIEPPDELGVNEMAVVVDGGFAMSFASADQ